MALPAYAMMVIKTFVLPLILDLVKKLLFSQPKGYGWREKLFNKIRELITSSETTIDDAVLLPILDQIEIATRSLNDEAFVMAFMTEFLTEIANTESPKVWGDTLLEFFEEAVKASETTWDDKLVLPMIALARQKVAQI